MHQSRAIFHRNSFRLLGWYGLGIQYRVVQWGLFLCWQLFRLRWYRRRRWQGVCLFCPQLVLIWYGQASQVTCRTWLPLFRPYLSCWLCSWWALLPTSHQSTSTLPSSLTSTNQNYQTNISPSSSPHPPHYSQLSPTSSSPSTSSSQRTLSLLSTPALPSHKGNYPCSYSKTRHTALIYWLQELSLFWCMEWQSALGIVGVIRRNWQWRAECRQIWFLDEVF